jgi:alpha-L-arabinofuranosidase
MRYPRRTFLRQAAVAAALPVETTIGAAVEPVLTIQTDREGPAISPMLYGIFFEEINHSGDGGLYAEMVQGRTFPGGRLGAWSAVGNCRIGADGARPLNAANPTALRVDAAAAGGGAANTGYWGMAVRSGARYRLEFHARAEEGFAGTLEARLEGAGGEPLASAPVPSLSGAWKQVTLILQPAAASTEARLVLRLPSPGTVWLNAVSLMPEATWKNRPNGLRPDLAQLLADLEPAFLRFPGGCYVEGGDYTRDAFRWKTTLGAAAGRPGHWNQPWAYWSSDGLGYHEYLQMAEDLGAEPLFVVNCGMSHRETVPMEKLGEWIEDALDAVEYANGPVESRWGAARAKNGHPKPFNLKYLEIGNENGGPAYQERYAAFYKALKARYPELHLIANTSVRSAPMEIVDHHYYGSAHYLRSVGTRYDTYDRKGPAVFVGEYASNSQVGTGNLAGALAEAACMMGFERNADVVKLAAYAPLLYHVKDRRWPVNLIGFDGTRAFGTPSYYVQKLFAAHRGDSVTPSKMECREQRTDERIDRGAIGLGTWNTRAEFKDVRVTRAGIALLEGDFSRGLEGWRRERGQWNIASGALAQTGEGTDLRITAGDPAWTDYSLSLKARKTSGSEGFLILFRLKDAGNFYWLNIGGWGNTLTAIERTYREGKSRVPGESDFTVETGRWYDIRIDVRGPQAECFIDGASILKAADLYESVRLPELTAVVNRVRETREWVVKVANFAPEPRKTTVILDGAAAVAERGTAITLTSANPEDENTLEQPRRVAPVTKTVSGVGKRFEYTFPAYSLTILRFGEK